MSASISCLINANLAKPNVFTLTRRKPFPALAGGPARSRLQSQVCPRGDGKEDARAWKAHIKALKAAGRALKAAGVKPAGKNNKGGDASPVAEQPDEGLKETTVADVASTPAAGNQKTPKKSDGAKLNGRGGKSHPGKNLKSASTANLSTQIEEVPTVSGASGAIPGFTDYQLNVLPVAAKPIVAVHPLVFFWLVDIRLK